MLLVITIPAFGDNFVYVCEYGGGSAFAVDPCDSAAVIKVLKERGFELKDIFVTHHHFDHTAGVADLKRRTGCAVYGPKSVGRGIADGDIIRAGDMQIEVIATPGHTKDSVCYYIRPTKENSGIVFTGDTMFVGGCGRVLESDFKTMYESLLRLAALPANTLVYCGHDYTVENYEFALTIERDNEKVAKRLQQIQTAVKEGDYTVPSTIGIERETNIFLRSDTAEVKRALGMKDDDAVAVFTKLRRRKDVF